ncbi:hypothetical protein G6F32_016709 [Rhizopus arrhizus]|nr:hypothetical protein G6F32_016709 [Rhizopus arrhizus]
MLARADKALYRAKGNGRNRRVAARAIRTGQHGGPVSTDLEHAADPGHRALSLAAWAGAAAAAIECGHRRQR